MYVPRSSPLLRTVVYLGLALGTIPGKKVGGKRQQARFPWKPVIACEVGGTEKLKRLWEVARVIFLIASAVAQANDFP